MKLKYEELLSSKSIKPSDLPNDIKSEIIAISKLKRVYNLLSSTSKSTTVTEQKISEKDELICGLLNQMQGGSSNELKKEVSQVGLTIDTELANMFEKGKTKVSSNELKSFAPKTYSIIWDSYEDGGQNGVETSHYLITETEKEVFTLNKK